jgi:uncharacterized pyridoxamine 5'-phosphate oxidase family protein
MNLNNELKKVGVFFLATSADNVPTVRPFGASAEIDGLTYICTGSGKNVYHQLVTNAHFEIAAMYQDGSWLRVKGEAYEEKSLNIKKLFLADNPFLAKIYGDKLDTFAVFRLDKIEAQIVK